MNTVKTSPLATYRLQLHRDQDFEAAAELISYLSRLGVSHLYSSPILRARPGSTHGYDVVDPLVVNPELGDESQFKNLIGVLRRYGLGFLLDIVPNHMAACSENPYWYHVLTYGSSSPYADWFDIEWRTPDPEMWGRVLAPVLGAPLKKMILKEELHLEWYLGRFILKVHDQVWPIDPATVPHVLLSGWPALESLKDADSPEVAHLRAIAEELDKLPSVVHRVRGTASIDVPVAEDLLVRLTQTIEGSPRLRQWAEETALQFGMGDRGHQRMRKLVDAQPYRLVLWRKAARFMNYRRFFAINELVSVRQENPRVFAATHETILRWVRERMIDGLRIDHIDGLRDPLDYLNQLEQAIARVSSNVPATPLWVEKILGHDEQLPVEWPVQGTTGYEFLNQVEAIFVSPSGFSELEDWYRRMQRHPASFPEAVLIGKRKILKDDLAPHIGRLADMLLRTAELVKKNTSVPEFTQAGTISAVNAHADCDRHDLLVADSPSSPGAEFSKAIFVAAITEVLVALPIYRSYVRGSTRELSGHDIHYLERAIAGARTAGVAEPAAIEFLEQVLLLKRIDTWPEDAVQSSITFLQKLQQFSGPAAAKGIEDTALYMYVPLVSLNEVGGQPDISLESALTNLHEANAYRAKHLPHSMLCVTTHDTKRTADVRSRLDVLSEIPTQWKACITRWLKAHRTARTSVGGILAPEFSAEYLFYQTAVGMWPQSGQAAAERHALDEAQRGELRERLEQYMLKAMREAKRHTNWATPNEPYEAALVAFIRRLIPAQPSRFESELQELVDQIAFAGYWNALSRTAIQFTAPGFPDIYQGDDLWNFALVDPDNRRPVDFEYRNRTLLSLAEELESNSSNPQNLWENMLDHPADGRIKLFLIHRILNARRSYEALFQHGTYLPLEVQGSRQQHLCAFYRRYEEQELIVVVPRLTHSLTQQPNQAPIGNAVWNDTTLVLPEISKTLKWVNGLTAYTVDVDRLSASNSATLSVSRLLEHVPVGIYFGVPRADLTDSKA